MDAAVSERRRPEGANRRFATGGVGSSPGVAFKYGEVMQIHGRPPIYIGFYKLSLDKRLDRIPFDFLKYYFLLGSF